MPKNKGAIIAKHNDLVIETGSIIPLDEELKVIKKDAHDVKLQTQKLTLLGKILNEVGSYKNIQEEEEDIQVTSGCGIITITQASEKGGKPSAREKVTVNGYSGYFGGP